MGDYSMILFARPSFTEGMARILDFGNTLSEYNQSMTGEQADRLAFFADWEAIGHDIKGACPAIADVKKIAKR